MAEKTIGELMIDSIVAARTRQDEKHFAELGQLIVAHAHAEASIHLLARKLSGLPDEKARLIFGGMRIGDLTDRIHKMMVLDKIDGENLINIKNCLEQFSKISTERDKFVHRTIEYVQDQGLSVTNWMTAKSMLNAEIQIFNYSDLVQMRRDLTLIAARLLFVVEPSFGKSNLIQSLQILQEPWAYKPTPHDAGKRKRRPVKAK